MASTFTTNFGFTVAGNNEVGHTIKLRDWPAT
jgi:hypothetical protein